MTLTDTSVCVYEGSPAVTVRSGKTGDQYGLCASCADSTDRTDAVSEVMEGFRTRMREAGRLDERIEDFINAVIICAPLVPGGDPLAGISAVFHYLAKRIGVEAEVTA
ncbi:hypothetical protein ACFVYR_00905 [Streptomyces sp. NPDC058284]|uniref:hypothetical protein n=1 Tax=unclassified Streptomyces TaxID=2593676 RepID=UPI0036662F1F